MNRPQALLVLLAFTLTLPTAAAQDDLVLLEEFALRAAVKHVAPTVVRIETIGGRERVGNLLIGQGPTTGVIVSADGFIVSSAFNFVQQPASTLVTLPTGKRVPADIVARDRSCMLVLLKVESDEPLPVPTAVSQDAMQVGQWSVAVGRTYDQESPNLSVGVLSARNRIWGRAIQTDAKVSPSNYGGPLVDIRGRVLGVLVPLSPDSQGDLAGAEWYDSGIGFAIPLADINARLDRFKQGDLSRGLLGISLKGGPNTKPAEVAASQVKSPAYDAGIRAGDVIVECNGVSIQRSAQLRHALGRLYADDKVAIVALRDDQRIEFEATLVDELLPYDPPFMGILPARSTSLNSEGVPLRFVFPNSGAERAQLEPEDRITKIDNTPVGDTTALRQALLNHIVGDQVQLKIRRGNEELERALELSSLPTSVPAELPPAIGTDVIGTDANGDDANDVDTEAPQIGVVDIQLPEEPNRCFAYVPSLGKQSYGVLVHLMTPGDDDRDRLLEQWRPICDAFHLILVAPHPQNPQRWVPTEAEFVGKTIDFVTDRYEVDTRRIALLGRQSAGSMAFFVGLRAPEVVHGIAVVDAAIPPRLRPPTTDPVQSLAFYLAYGRESPVAERVRDNVEALQAMRHNVVVRESAGTVDALTDEQRTEIARWIDSLDRI
jgi:serine protease Do